MTLRKFEQLYNHYKFYYDMEVSKITYRESEKRAIEDEEWL